MYYYFILQLEKTFNDFPNFLILKVLTDKIKLAVNAYKEKILAVKEINAVFQRYIKSKDPHKGIITNVINDFTGFELLKLPEIHFSDVKSNQSMTVIHVLLILLKTIKKTLINSSEDFERIFKYPLSLIVKDKDRVEVDFKNIHKREFRTYILLDDFIQKMLMSIKLKTIGLSKDNFITELVSYIDEKPSKGNKEKESMTIYLMNKLSEIHEEKFLQREQDKELKALAEKKRAFIQKKAKYENMKLARKRHINIKEEEEETKDLDIDELVNYISENGSKGKKSKKKKQKNKKNKSGSNQNSMNSSTNNVNTTAQSEEDKEINKIKEQFSKDSCNRYLIRKIIPYISQEWINKYE